MCIYACLLSISAPRAPTIDLLLRFQLLLARTIIHWSFFFRFNCFALDAIPLWASIFFLDASSDFWNRIEHGSLLNFWSLFTVWLITELAHQSSTQWIRRNVTHNCDELGVDYEQVLTIIIRHLWRLLIIITVLSRVGRFNLFDRIDNRPAKKMKSNQTSISPRKATICSILSYWVLAILFLLHSPNRDQLIVVMYKHVTIRERTICCARSQENFVSIQWGFSIASMITFKSNWGEVRNLPPCA